MKYSDFYLAFENKFRGSSLDVNEKLVFYDGLLEEISSRFIPSFSKIVLNRRW